MKFLGNTLVAALLIAGLSTTAFGSPCEEGTPKFTAGVVTCTAVKKVTITKDDKTLSEVTFGLVKSVTAKSKISLSMDDLLGLLTDKGGALPEQTVNFTIETQSTPIILNVSLAPYFTLTGNTIADLQVIDASPNITKMSGSFPQWILDLIKTEINGSKELKDELVEALNKVTTSL